MIAIVDYGVGNLFSLKSSFAAIGAQISITSDAQELKAADGILLPGVGAFRDAAQKLEQSGLSATLRELAQNGKPLLGICLGMQLLFEESREYGVHKGLGILEGKVLPLSKKIPEGYKVPHIGWNALEKRGDCPLYKNIADGECVYFVHSYYADECDGIVTATTEYGADITASVQQGNVFGCQFHPEKSGRVGLDILRAFVEIGEGGRC